MALTAAQTTQIYEIFGIPQNGGGAVVSAVASIFGPVCDSVDFSALITKLNALLSALTGDQITRIAALLSRWDAITSTSPLRVLQSSATRGTTVDHPAERAAIRTALGNLIGIAVPTGGFAAETVREHLTMLSR